MEHAPTVYVQVYCVVVAGATLIETVVAPPGLQLKFPPAMDGVAVRATEAPAQIAALLIV